MSRNYGIMSGPQHLGGASMSRSASSADTRADSSSPYELGGFGLFLIVIFGPSAIVLGLVMAYMVFV